MSGERELVAGDLVIEGGAVTGRGCGLAPVKTILWQCLGSAECSRYDDETMRRRDSGLLSCLWLIVVNGPGREYSVGTKFATVGDQDIRR